MPSAALLQVIPAVGAAMRGGVAAGLEAAQPGNCAGIATALAGVPGIHIPKAAAHLALAMPVSLHWAAMLPLAGVSTHTVGQMDFLAKLLHAAPSELWLSAYDSDSPAGTYSALLRLFQNIDAELARVLRRHPGAADGSGPRPLALGSPAQRTEALATAQAWLLQPMERAARKAP